MTQASSSSGLDQGHLSYVAIAKGTTFLAVHSTGTKNAQQTAALVLDRIDLTKEAKQTFIHGAHQIHYVHTLHAKIPGGLTFVAIATEAMGRRVPFTCLMDLKIRFMETYTVAQIACAGHMEFSSFNTTIADRMRVLTSPPASNTTGGTSKGSKGQGGNDNDRPENGNGDREAGEEEDQARQVRRELDAVKDIMTQNIERVLDRGERIEVLVDKSSHLTSSAITFQRRSKEVKRQMWWGSIRTTALIACVSLVLLYFLVGVGCGLPAWDRCV